jgi:hypothetical protein
LSCVIVCSGEKVAVLAPVAVVFNKIDSDGTSYRLEVTMSGLPSPLRSPTAIEIGVCSTSKSAWALKLAVLESWTVVLSSTDTSPLFSSATAMSGLPSPLKSPIAIASGFKKTEES